MGHGAAHLESAERRQTYVTLPLLLLQCSELQCNSVQQREQFMASLWKVCSLPLSKWARGLCLLQVTVHRVHRENCTLYTIQCTL